MNYAIIEDGVVVNIIVLNDENAAEFPGAVKLGTQPAFIGDLYADGVFIHPNPPEPDPEA